MSNAEARGLSCTNSTEEVGNREEGVDSPQWRQARQRMADIRDLVGEREFESAAAATLAQRWPVSVKTVWRQLERYRRDGTPRAFLHRPRGGRPGVSQLTAVVENIIRDSARGWWRQTENATIAEIHPTVRPAGKIRANPVIAAIGPRSRNPACLSKTVFV